jgi:hypothetical protein
MATGAPASPQLATREHVEKRYQRDETEHGPCQLRAAADIPAGGQVNPHQDHGNGMEEADQEFEDLLHCLNLPGPPWVPVRSLPAAPKSPAVRFCRGQGRVRGHDEILAMPRGQSAAKDGS